MKTRTTTNEDFTSELIQPIVLIELFINSLENIEFSLKRCIPVRELMEITHDCKKSMLEVDDFQQTIFSKIVKFGNDSIPKKIRLKYLLQYICCDDAIQENFQTYQEGHCSIVAEINIDDNSRSKIEFLIPAACQNQFYEELDDNLPF